MILIDAIFMLNYRNYSLVFFCFFFAPGCSNFNIAPPVAHTPGDTITILGDDYYERSLYRPYPHSSVTNELIFIDTPLFIDAHYK